jgi:large subunit ribosomal protein L23
MSIFSMRPKENKKTSEAFMEKAKAAVSASKKAGDVKKEGGGKKQAVQGFKRDARGILTAPHTTEKAMRAAEQGTYVFKVMPRATKPEIKKAVEKTYGVHVTAVRVIRLYGKTVRLGRSLGRRADIRKAMVTVKKGESIQF